MYCTKPLVTVSMETKLCYHDNVNVGLDACAKFHDHTCSTLKVTYKYSHNLRLVAIGYEYAMLP